MSTHAVRRVSYKKRRDPIGVIAMLLPILALPVVGYVGYLMYTGNTDKLAELGVRTINAPAGAPNSAKTPAPAPVATDSTDDKTPEAPKFPGVKTPPLTPAPGESTELASAEINKPAPTPTKPVEQPAMSLGVIDGPPGNVGEAIERIGAKIKEALDIPRKVLVVWVVDETDSAQDYRQQLQTHLPRMYSALKIPNSERRDDAALVSSVVAFSAAPRWITPEPTDKPSEVVQGVTNISTSNGSTENPITALRAVSDELITTYRLQQQRHMIVVLVTDEVGDDQDQVDTVLTSFKKYSVPVYTIGVLAPFGGTGGYAYKSTSGLLGDADPSTETNRSGDTQRAWGPETREVEWVKITYPDGSGDFSLRDLGLGPYTLTRLSQETGGEYFALSTRQANSGWDIPRVSQAASNLASTSSAPAQREADSYFAALNALGQGGGPPPSLAVSEVVLTPKTPAAAKPMVLKRYAPAYVSKADYDASIKANKAKQVLLEAAKKPPVPVLPMSVATSFDASDEARKTRALLEGQRPAALVQPMIDDMYNLLKAGDADSAKLTEPRWRAGFDLAYGRILAAKSRADSYMFALAAMRTGNPATSITPSDEPIKNSIIDKMAASARERLQRVVDEHPGTPWAEAARRELSYPMSWKFLNSPSVATN